MVIDKYSRGSPGLSQLKQAGFESAEQMKFAGPPGGHLRRLGRTSFVFRRRRHSFSNRVRRGRRAPSKRAFLEKLAVQNRVASTRQCCFCPMILICNLAHPSPSARLMNFMQIDWAEQAGSLHGSAFGRGAAAGLAQRRLIS